jgi:hypothetical protein
MIRMILMMDDVLSCSVVATRVFVLCVVTPEFCVTFRYAFASSELNSSLEPIYPSLLCSAI